MYFVPCHHTQYKKNDLNITFFFYRKKMSNKQYSNHAVMVDDGHVVPASPLDNVLKFKNGDDLDVSLFDFLNGDRVTSENRQEFYKAVVNNVKNKHYPTTDHLITCVKIDDLYCVYFPLDNSVRANMNYHPLHKRLPNICQIVNKIIDSLNGRCVVFFSESCRPSFSGGMNNKEQLTSWLSMRQIISTMCGLEFLTDKRNNEDPSDMSFGLSVFYKNRFLPLLSHISMKQF